MRASRTCVIDSAGGERAIRARPVFPFTAIVGQEEMRLALVLNAIDPMIGGVLVMGHRGTGKTTVVRALAGLLPDMSRVKGCIYSCDPGAPAAWCSGCQARARKSGRMLTELAPPPVVELPLGSTEDRVCGSLDIGNALKKGRVVFQPGLLARANRGFLYIDEVNLLEDHIVDLLLDVAASGWNIVEREGISAGHPARFVLIGSGNPEEGELRPQLLDRFGLHVKIATITETALRIEIAERRDRFERDPAAFAAAMEPAQARLRRKIVAARRRLASVQVPRDLMAAASDVCVRLSIDGHRGELTIVRAARALAALEGRGLAATPDLRRVAAMSLRHRLRKDPLGGIDDGGRMERALEVVLPEARADGAA